MLFPSAFSFILLQVVFVALVVSVTERFLCSDMQFVLYAHCLHRLSVPSPLSLGGENPLETCTHASASVSV